MTGTADRNHLRARLVDTVDAFLTKDLLRNVDAILCARAHGLMEASHLLFANDCRPARQRKLKGRASIGPQT
jgi:hypothetical protein